MKTRLIRYFESKPTRSFVCLLLSILVLLSTFSLTACQQTRDMTGKYQASNAADAKSTVGLQLKSDGKGSWTVNREDVPFTWETRGDEIWLHYKSGGIVSGKLISDSSIVITLPGVGDFSFKKVGP